MKLSELNTDRALDVLCELTPYASSIMEDEQILSALDGFMNRNTDEKKKTNESGTDENDASMVGKGIKMFGGLVKNIPLLLKTHRCDVYGILSVMNERPVAEIAAQPIRNTIQQTRELFRDPELLSFFKSSAQQGQTEPSAPSAPSHVSGQEAVSPPFQL